MKQIQLNKKWRIGAKLGAGGFGEVYEASSEGIDAAIKFVPKAPGADRDLLADDLSDASNVVPIIDSGETEADYVIVMPRASHSLRQAIDSGDIQGSAGAVEVLRDVAQCLADLAGRVVHRDIKPENILYHEGRWCLCDFGIARYAEATTAPDTKKYAWSSPYAAPERWRSERATTATDIYSLGIVGYELIAGSRPFGGPDFREQHLHEEPQELPMAVALLQALLAECLFKAPGARPGPGNVLARLGNVDVSSSTGLAELQEANQAAVAKKAEVDRASSEAATAEEIRERLFDAAEKSLAEIYASLEAALTAAAPSAEVDIEGRAYGRSGGSKFISLGVGRLTLPAARPVGEHAWNWHAPAFDVVAATKLDLQVPRDSHGYEGRSHALWYCDPQVEGEYGWYETAFMSIGQNLSSQAPYSLDPGEEAGKAVAPGIHVVQTAWPFTRLNAGDLDDFIDRWASWFAIASSGKLARPSRMPERDPNGSWRR